MKGSSFEYMTRILFFGLLFFSFSCFPFLVILFIPLMTYTKQLLSKKLQLAFVAGAFSLS